MSTLTPFSGVGYSPFDDSVHTDVIPPMEYNPDYEDEFVETTIVSDLILKSQLYTEAYSILSSDLRYGKSYLAMLEMIPYSHDVRDENFWDRASNAFGGTSGYDKAVQDAFNAAMDEIRSLMQDYYSFLSKLPTEQVQQLADAGINAAITGEGVTTSSITAPDPSSSIVSNPSQTEYDNKQLSDGITRFVEFIGSMANLTSVGINAQNLLGLLDIAEREGYNKQETHDLLLAQLGVTTESPYRVLTPGNTPTINTLSDTARSDQRVKSAEAVAAAKALDSPVSVNVGNDPNNVATYEVKSGADWLAEISRFQIANRFANVMIQNLRSESEQMYAGVLSTLENEYNVANFGALTDQARFNSDYFSSRNGVIEGTSQTGVTESLSFIRQHEAYIKSVEAWLSEYRSNIIESWGEQLEQRPNLAPYFYKAMFDFNMEDTFYHQNAAAQGLKYGMQAINSIGSFLGHLTGFKKPKKAPGPKGPITPPKADDITDVTYL